jgi:MFS family permease
VLTFAAGLFLFQLANAAMLPVVGAGLVYDGESHSSLIVAALIILPQIVVALLAPWVGQQARRWGRRPLLLIGFGTLPIRALLFALTADPLFLVGLQLLDGISAAIVGVLTVLVTADLTHGTGRFNLAQGIVGTASGAALSTALFGYNPPNMSYKFTPLVVISRVVEKLLSLSSPKRSIRSTSCR